MPGKTEAMPDGIAGDPGTAEGLRHRSPIPADSHERRTAGERAQPGGRPADAGRMNPSDMRERSASGTSDGGVRGPMLTPSDPPQNVPGVNRLVMQGPDRAQQWPEGNHAPQQHERKRGKVDAHSRLGQ